MPPSPTEARAALVALKGLLAFEGRHLFPVGADKAPLSCARPNNPHWKWNKETFTDAELITFHLKGYRLGLRPASLGLWVADIDEGIEQSWDLLTKRFATPLAFPRTLGKNRGFHAYYALPADVSLRIGNDKWRLDEAAGELRGHNGYVVVWDLAATLAATEHSHNNTEQGISPFPDLIEDKHTKPINPRVIPEGAEKPAPRLKEAIKFLGPDVLGPTPDYEQWIAIGQAIHFETSGHPDGFALWDHWSSRFDNYPGPGEPTTASKWTSFNAIRANGVTGGTIYNLSEDLGWHEDFTAEFEELSPLDTGTPSLPDLIGTPEPTPINTDAPDELPHLSQGMFADAWIDFHKRNWLYDPRQIMERRWLRWKANHWTTGDEAAPMRSMQLMIREQCRLVAQRAEDAEKIYKALLATYDRLQVIQSCLTLAGERLKHRKWDANENQVGLPNGKTIDLLSGDIRTQRRKDYLLRTMGCEPADDYGDLWPTLLVTWTDGDKALERYLRAVIGYSLFGNAREQVFFIIHGPGKTGKSLFIETMSLVFGSYGHTAPMTLFTGRSDQHPTDLAHLDGPRFVRTSEADTGATWRTDVIKNVCGSDQLSARFMRKDPFSFIPVCTLFVVCNHPPSFRGGLVDSGMARRIQAIRWTNVIPVNDRRTDLPRILQERHLSHILRWALDGAMDYTALDGLPKCEAVEKETLEYIGIEDTVGDFMNQRCVIGPEYSVPAGELQMAYRIFCEDNFRQEVVGSVWAQELRNRGMQRWRSNAGTKWRGIGLSDDSGDDFSPQRRRHDFSKDFDVLDDSTNLI